ncbi:MAG: DUF5606 domain-containing protein, partial [Bacteroidales bacterium]|nr:DUF5606 domain-containing protein [Bacteroidales bacterium]
MDLKEIMSVSGQAGLFKFVSQARNGIIVESFADKKRSFVSANVKVSSLEDIAVFTDHEEVPLKEILKKIDSLDTGIPIPDSRSTPDALKEFMDKVLPDYDRNRVYVSDIRKIANWYTILKAHDLLKFEPEDVDSGSDSGSDSDSNRASDSNKASDSTSS